jgi:hypothetical protein
MQILEGENGRFCQKRLKMIKNDERQEYNFLAARARLILETDEGGLPCG